VSKENAYQSGKQTIRQQEAILPSAAKASKESLSDLLARYRNETSGTFPSRTDILVNTRGGDDRTPLHVACVRGAIDDVAVLLQNGADVGARSTSGETPLFDAVGLGRLDIVAALIDAGAKIDVINVFGKTPIDLAMAQVADPEMQKRFSEVLNFLLSVKLKA
jgi:ankyrin repeat protein